MIQFPVIVTFANQKGGVGKTTLCVLFAHYLVAKDVKVRILDCDRQMSVVRRRKADIDRYGEEAVPFPADPERVSNAEEVYDMVEKIFGNQDYEVTLIDTPGLVLNEPNKLILQNSDLIVTPFHYDKMTLSSTSTFIMCLDMMKRTLGQEMRARLYLIPNLHDGRIGTRSELMLWEEARDIFSRYGVVTPKISRVSSMERISTVMPLDQQLKLVTPAFDKLYLDIFGSLEQFRMSPKSTIEQKTTEKPVITEMIPELTDTDAPSDLNFETDNNTTTDGKPE